MDGESFLNISLLISSDNYAFQTAAAAALIPLVAACSNRPTELPTLYRHQPSPLALYDTCAKLRKETICYILDYNPDVVYPTTSDMIGNHHIITEGWRVTEYVYSRTGGGQKKIRVVSPEEYAKMRRKSEAVTGKKNYPIVDNHDFLVIPRQHRT